MIPISKALKKKFEKVKCYLDLLADPVTIEKNFEGVYAVRNKNNKVIPGALQYGESGEGPKVAILGGIHMNEMAGVYALLQFHNSWAKGVRPKRGTILTSIGHLERAKEFINTALKSDSLSPSTWNAFSRTDDFFNFNRIPWDILTRKEIENRHEQHACEILKNVIIPARGKVLDIHNTSVDAPPMVTLFMKKGETPKMSLERMNATNVTKDFPIEDYIIWKPGPYNGMESIRSFGEISSNAIPILIEAGAGFDPKSFGRANDYARIWLRNVLGMKLEKNIIPDNKIEFTRSHYIETGALYHPCVRAQDYSYLDKVSFEESKLDTFILIRDWPQINSIEGWSTKAKRVLEKLKKKSLSKQRLDNFEPIKQGEIIAIGLKTGLEIRCPQDGHVLMIGKNPFIKPTFNEAFANFGIMLK